MDELIGCLVADTGEDRAAAQVESVSREVIACAHRKAGKDAVGEVAAAVSGLARFV